MKLFCVTMFSVKLLVVYWILDDIIATQPLNSILIMPNTHEFFPLIRSGEFALFLYRVLPIPYGFFKWCYNLYSWVTFEKKIKLLIYSLRFIMTNYFIVLNIETTWATFHMQCSLRLQGKATWSSWFYIYTYYIIVINFIWSLWKLKL